MAISGGLCDLHPGISAGLSASPAASHSGTLCPFSQTDKPPQSTLEYILSKTLGLSRHCSLLTGECPNAFSISVGTEPLQAVLPSLRQTNPSQSTLEYILSKTLGLSRHCSLLTGERPNTFSVSVGTEPLLPS